MRGHPHGGRGPKRLPASRGSRLANDALPIAAVLAVLAVFALMPAAAPAADNETGAWIIFTATDRFPPREPGSATRWRYWLDAHARYPDAGSGVNQLLIRPGLGYEISPDVTAWAGYARFRTHGRSGRTTTEDRFWQQLVWNAKRWDDASLSTRLRVEQRALSSGDDTGVVLRWQLRYARAVAPGSTTQLIASIEPFFDLRDTDYGATSGLSQGRLYVAVRWQLSERNQFEAGYQNQYVFADSGDDTMRHLAMLNFRTRF